MAKTNGLGQWEQNFFAKIGYRADEDTYAPIVEEGRTSSLLFVKFMSNRGKTDMAQADAFEAFLKANKIGHYRITENDYYEDRPANPTRNFEVDLDQFSTMFDWTNAEDEE